MENPLRYWTRVGMNHHVNCVQLLLITIAELHVLACENNNRLSTTVNPL